MFTVFPTSYSITYFIALLSDIEAQPENLNFEFFKNSKTTGNLTWDAACSEEFLPVVFIFIYYLNITYILLIFKRWLNFKLLIFICYLFSSRIYFQMFVILDYRRITTGDHAFCLSVKV